MNDELARCVKTIRVLASALRLVSRRSALPVYERQLIDSVLLDVDKDLAEFDAQADAP